MIDTLVPAFIPSPSRGEWELFGVVPIRAYALCIMAGIVAAWFLGSRRWAARGGRPETLETAVLVAVPMGIVGARIYHVITDYQLYFLPDSPKRPIDALFIWEGGLGIFGAVALGALGVWLVCRRRGASFLAVADALAPGVVLAQAFGRFGNWFNQELFGRPTTLPWGLQIDLAHRPAGYTQYETFHPTFLYEVIWNVGVCLLLVWAGKRFSLGRGKTFALYLVGYLSGRFWIESFRIDPVNHVGGIRLNNIVSLLLLLAAIAWFVWLLRNRPGLEDSVEPGAGGGAEPLGARAGGDGTDGSTTESDVDVQDGAPADAGTGADDDPIETTEPHGTTESHEVERAAEDRSD